MFPGETYLGQKVQISIFFHRTSWKFLFDVLVSIVMPRKSREHSVKQMHFPITPFCQEGPLPQTPAACTVGSGNTRNGPEPATH